MRPTSCMPTGNPFSPRPAGSVTQVVALSDAMGFASYAELTDVLEAHRARVEHQFDQVFADKVKGDGGCAVAEDSAASWVWSSALADDSAEEQLRERVTELGFTDATAVLSRLRSVWTSTRYEGLPERSRERFDIIAQRALEAAQKAQPPERRGDTIARLRDRE